MAGERTYLALGRRVLAEAALAERDGATADRELSHALDAIAEHEAPLAEWKVCATAARREEAHGRQPRAQAYWARSVAVLDGLAASLGDDAELRRTFLSPSVGAGRPPTRRAPNDLKSDLATGLGPRSRFWRPPRAQSRERLRRRGFGGPRRPPPTTHLARHLHCRGRGDAVVDLAALLHGVGVIRAGEHAR